MPPLPCPNTPANDITILMFVTFFHELKALHVPVMGAIAISPRFILLAVAVLAACGRLGSGKTDDEPQPQIVDLSRPNTPENRAVQVGWTVASAAYCGFNVPRDKVKSDYLAYERKQGAAPEAVSGLEQRYNASFATFLASVRDQPNYCSKQRIEAIRPDISRHLKGDYTPSPRPPPPPPPSAPPPP